MEQLPYSTLVPGEVARYVLHYFISSVFLCTIMESFDYFTYEALSLYCHIHNILYKVSHIFEDMKIKCNTCILLTNFNWLRCSVSLWYFQLWFKWLDIWYFQLKEKRKRSDSVLWQKPLHPQKLQKSIVKTFKKCHQNKLQLHNDCGPT